MEQKSNGSPLSRICYQDSTFMLEALLPFVPINLKLPLAMLIKYNEWKRMLTVFHNTKLLSSYGLTEEEFSMQGFAKQLSGCPNPKLYESISQIGQMMKMMEIMQAMENIQDTPDKPNQQAFTNEYGPPPESKSIEAHIDTDELSDPLEDFDPDQFVKEIFS